MCHDKMIHTVPHGVWLRIAADREVQRILLELLNQMDGFDTTVNVKVRCGMWCGGVHDHTYIRTHAYI